MNSLENLRWLFKGLKRRNSVLKLCPRCRSHKITLSSHFDIWLTPERYVCEDCKYIGPVVMEIGEERKQTEG